MSSYNEAHMSKLDKVCYNAFEKVKSCHLADEKSSEAEEDIYLSMMPSIIIFVHGVNSEGEWYKNAEAHFCEGLNARLGREGQSKLVANTYLGADPISNKESPDLDLIQTGQFNSPVIPFYWGYQSHPDEIDKYDISLRDEGKGRGYWGGGPFQNGCTTLQDMYGDGVQDLIGFIDPQTINPIEGRAVHRCPPRHYMVHAAQRLAFLIDTIRQQPGGYQQTINLVCHSQGNMIGMLSQLMVKTRAADTLHLNQPPYSLDYVPLMVLASNVFNIHIPTVNARKRTLKNIADKIARDFNSPHPVTGKKVFSEQALWQDIKPLIAGDNYDEQNQADHRGKVFLNFCAHDRLIGVTAIEGIGWQGIEDYSLLMSMPNFSQRVFAGGVTLGKSTGYYYDFSEARVDDQFWYPEPERVHLRLSGKDNGIIILGSTLAQGPVIGILTSGVLGINYTYNQSGTAGLMPIYNDPKDRRVYINAPIINSRNENGKPKPLTVELKKRGSGGISYDQGTIKLIDDTTKRDWPYLVADIPRKTQVVKGFNYTDYAGQYMMAHPVMPQYEYKTITESDAEFTARVESISGAVTDHSNILAHEKYPEIITNILTYDLAIGINTMYRDRDFWTYLHKLADWTYSDPYFNPELAKDNSVLFLNKDNIGEMPEGLDKETLPLLGFIEISKVITRQLRQLKAGVEGIQAGMEEYGKAEQLNGEIARAQGEAINEAISNGIESLNTGLKTGMEEYGKAQLLNGEVGMAQGKAINEAILKGLEGLGEYANKAQETTINKMKQLAETNVVISSQLMELYQHQDDSK